MYRITQGIAKVTFEDKTYKWFRISRQKIPSLENNLRALNRFYYAKIYHYHGGGKKLPKYDSRRYVGNQIGWINKEKSAYFE